ncbi:hypothetical protein O181_079147 [Austropuccinia psidii MF-1]|uniref:GAG-pre-integrase domain-containing protein n=1 Tax=Austropuccinia psidii MF-1 TaxID=1389203 RepID=A0A9Q3FLI5_9BASI|nr:hypothetical protein [Austropuccinia psidii MF-1]
MTDKLLEAKDSSNIPVLNGLNYIDADANTAVKNKWAKISSDAISFISSKLDPTVFAEVVDNETIDDVYLLWNKINDQYASKTAINRGRVVMDWVAISYKGNLDDFIIKCQKTMIDMASVNIKIPPDVLSYWILGKLRDDSNMYHLADSLAMSPDATENHNTTLNRLQSFARHQESKHHSSAPEKNSAALITATNVNTQFPSKMVYFCANGTHNPLNTTHKPNRCYVEFPHLCPKRKNEKDKENSLTKSSPTTHLSTAQALMTNLKMESLSSQVIIDCAATHHMFNQKSFFSELSEMTPFVFSTGDPSSTPHGEGIGSVSLKINGSTIELKGCLYAPQISKNLISLLQIFDEDITICKLPANLFEIISQDFKITGEIADRLMVVDCNPPQSNLTTSYPWHQRLGHPSNKTLKTLGLSPLNDSCQICMRGKSTLLPFLGQFDKVNQTLECVHLDLLSIPPTPSRDKLSLFSLWSNRSSRIKRIKTFGCKAVILIPKHLQSWKFSPSGEDGILLGYENKNSAYRILRIRDRTIVITRHALFAENHFPSIDSNPNSEPHSDRWIDLCEERDECISNEEILTDQGSSEITEGAECLQ